MASPSRCRRAEGVGADDEGVPGGGGHHGDHPGSDRGHRRHRPHAHPHVEGLHHHPRQARVRQVREGAEARQVGRGKILFSTYSDAA